MKCSSKEIGGASQTIAFGQVERVGEGIGLIAGGMPIVVIVGIIATMGVR